MVITIFWTLSQSFANGTSNLLPSPCHSDFITYVVRRLSAATHSAALLTAGEARQQAFPSRRRVETLTQYIQPFFSSQHLFCRLLHLPGIAEVKVEPNDLTFIGPRFGTNTTGVESLDRCSCFLWIAGSHVNLGSMSDELLNNSKANPRAASQTCQRN